MAAAFLDFRNFKMLTIRRAEMVKLRHRAMSRGSRSNCCRNGDFSIFQDGGRRYLGFLNFEILAVRRGQ